MIGPNVIPSPIRRKKRMNSIKNIGIPDDVIGESVHKIIDVHNNPKGVLKLRRFL